MGSLLEERKHINLHWGKPAPALLPSKNLATAAQAVLSDPSISVTSLQYGDSPGYQPLREELSLWLSSFYGTRVETDQLCVTGGASQGLATVLQVLADPIATKAVWLVEPCFHLACRIFEDAGLTGKLRVVPEGEEGVIDTDFLEREMALVDDQTSSKLTAKPKDPLRKTYSQIIFAVPTFSNPSGKTMPLSCRQSLVRIARKYDALVISDDIYDMLQWSSSSTTASHQKVVPLPRLIDIDRSLPPLTSDRGRFGHTLSNGSFSKLVGPGVRTGWIDTSPAIVEALAACGSTLAGGCPSQLVASMLAQLMRERFLQPHISDTLIPSYGRRREIMVEAIEKHLVPLGVVLATISGAKEYVIGGYFLWLQLPEGMMSSQLAKMAKEEENLVISPGAAFSVPGGHASFEPYLRLSFSYEDEAALSEGIARLARIVRRLSTEKQDR